MRPSTSHRTMPVSVRDGVGGTQFANELETDPTTSPDASALLPHRDLGQPEENVWVIASLVLFRGFAMRRCHRSVSDALPWRTSLVHHIESEIGPQWAPTVRHSARWYHSSFCQKYFGEREGQRPSLRGRRAARAAPRIANAAAYDTLSIGPPASIQAAVPPTLVTSENPISCSVLPAIAAIDPAPQTRHIWASFCKNGL